MRKLFHASTLDLTVGEDIPAQNRNFCSFNDYQRPTEVLLEDRCPNGSQSRLSSHFACDEAEFAAIYLDAELPRWALRQGQPHLYTIQMNDPGIHPMCLVDAIAKELSKDRVNLAEALADEYWSPTLEWKFWEYLCPEFRLLEQLQWPDLKSPSAIAKREIYYGESKVLDVFLSQRRGEPATPDQA